LAANIEANDGFLYNPKYAYDWMTFQDLSRFTGSAQAEFRPITWLALNGNVGLDRFAREEVNRLPRNTLYGAFGPPYQNGFIQNFGYDIYNLTTNASGTAVFNLNSDLTSTTSLGTQYLRETLHRIYAFGSVLTPGVEESLAGATAYFESGEDNTLNATVSAYAQQQLGWRDRLFLSGALRGDQNTAFGQNLGWVWYPSVSASWVVGDESFFPDIAAISNLRLRAAWGQSGLRPGPTDALQSFGPVIQPFAGAAAPGIVFDEIGNPDLKPEVATEWELGFESGFLDERLGLDLTYFNKTSKDALVSRPLAPSLGASDSRFENLGKVKNSGVEVLVNAQLVRAADFGWDMNVSGSAIKNELDLLGLDAEGNPLPDIVFGLLGDTQRHAEGFALGSWFQSPITEYNDANGDGILVPSEVTVNSDTSVFLGNPFPNREFSFSSSVTYRDFLRLSGLLDFKGGHEQMNFTRLNRCELPNAVCEEMYDPTTPLDVQAANVAWNYYDTAAGYVEKADFWKLREVALTLSVPQSIVDRVGRFSGLSVTLAGRNLKTWTDYSGFDPEVSFAGQSNFNSGDAGTLPPNRIYTIRLDANF
ncbi:MAG TPA: TonB-dependent receptor, partial [Longimicrobiaceae bacterium]